MDVGTWKLFVRPSLRMENRNSHRKRFHEIPNLKFFTEKCPLISTRLKSDKNKGHFTRQSTYVYDNTSSLLLDIIETRSIFRLVQPATI